MWLDWVVVAEQRFGLWGMHLGVSCGVVALFHWATLRECQQYLSSIWGDAQEVRGVWIAGLRLAWSEPSLFSCSLWVLLGCVQVGGEGWVGYILELRTGLHFKCAQCNMRGWDGMKH